MREYYIRSVIIKGKAFKSGEPLNLFEAVTLAREFRDRGYTFYIDEKISGEYQMRTSNQLEQLLARNLSSEKS